MEENNYIVKIGLRPKFIIPRSNNAPIQNN